MFGQPHDALRDRLHLLLDAVHRLERLLHRFPAALGSLHRPLRGLGDVLGFLGGDLGRLLDVGVILDVLGRHRRIDQLALTRAESPEAACHVPVHPDAVEVDDHRHVVGRLVPVAHLDLVCFGIAIFLAARNRLVLQELDMVRQAMKESIERAKKVLKD